MKNNKIDISVIIINHNRDKYLERCLRSCIDQIVFNKKFEIIFIDDGSTDNSFKIVKKFKSNVNIFRLKRIKEFLMLLIMLYLNHRANISLE